MKKKLLSLVLAAILVLCLVPASAFAASSIEFEPYCSLVCPLPIVAGDYALQSDVTLLTPWIAPKGTTRIDLNGHSITQMGVFKVIDVLEGTTLEIYDSVGGGQITGGKLGGILVSGANASLLLDNVKVTGNISVAENVGGVTLRQGNLTLSGGTQIFGNMVTSLSVQKPCNLYVEDGQAAVVSGANKMSVGVTLGTSDGFGTFAKGAAGDINYFESDKGESIIYDNGKLNIAHPVLTVSKKLPTTKDEVLYTGRQVELVNAPTDMTGIEVKYSLDGGVWTMTIPTAKEIGKYRIDYEVTNKAGYESYKKSGTLYSYIVEELSKEKDKEKKDKEYGFETCKKNSKCPLSDFSDLTPTYWYHDGIHFCLEMDLMDGFPGRKFMPNASITRAQLVMILYRIEGEPRVRTTNDFGDVAVGSWCEDAITWANSKGIVTGYEDGTFKPGQAITREQFAAIIYRYVKYLGGGYGKKWKNNLKFNDADDIQLYAEEAMCWCVENKVITGKSNKILDPAGTTTRAEAAAMIQRLCTDVE